MSEQDSLPCPGCHTPLPPEATGCQICMRPRTRQEIVRGYSKLREDKARKRRRPFLILAALLFLGGTGWLIKTHGSRLAAAASSAGGAIGRWADDLRNPSKYAMRRGPEPPAPPAPPAKPGEPVAPESAMRAQLFPEDSGREAAPPAGAPAAAPAARPAGPGPLAKNAWRVSGKVYDLATLRPVAGAEVTFLLNEQQPRSVATDAGGGYSIDLLKAEGWTVHVVARDRRRGQVLDIDPSYRIRDADERRAVFDNISDGDLVAAPVGWARASSKVALDLFVIPTRWNDADPY